MKDKIELGDEVRDTVTGFKGKAVARTTWISGCDRINVQPPVGKDGKLSETASFDEPMLEIIKKAKVRAEMPIKKGGPRMTIVNNKF